MYDRTRNSARGFLGGLNGAVGEIELDDGTRPHPKGKYRIQPGQKVTLRLPGGGGFYSPLQRDPSDVVKDVFQGRVSREAARTLYGVVLKGKIARLDDEETRKLRLHLRDEI